MEGWKNQLYFGDNLDMLRQYVPPGSVDLIYLDPPFNSKATYNVLFAEKNGTASAAQITAFDDFWQWDIKAEEHFHELVTEGPRKIAELVQALRSFLGANDMMAYLTEMAIRLVEMHRVLKTTGSLYLHCDSIAHPYLRLILDVIFDAKNRRNDIVWWYPNKLPTGGKLFDRTHDIILYYVKNNKNCIYNEVRIPTEYSGTQLVTKKVAGKRIPIVDPNTGKQVRVLTTDKPAGDVWRVNMIHPQSKERLGYPTQKPEALLERIIRASSNEGDLVLDPFCGCGTTLNVAERLNRRWIGIDITHLAITLIKDRLHRTFEQELYPYEVIGDPKDWSSALALAEANRHQFEWWALGLVSAQPAQDKRKGPDTGVDGYIHFRDDQSGRYKKVVVQVKSGKNLNVGQIRDLKGVMEREKAEMAAFISLHEPTRPMRQEAVSAGFYLPEHLPGAQYSRLQIMTIGDLLAGKQLTYPRLDPYATFKKAPRQRKGPSPEENQGNLL